MHWFAVFVFRPLWNKTLRQKERRLYFTASVYRLSSITRPDTSEAEWLTTSAKQFPVENPQNVFFKFWNYKTWKWAIITLKCGSPANQNKSSFILFYLYHTFNVFSPYTETVVFPHWGGLFFAEPMRNNKYVTMMDPFQIKYGKVPTAALSLASLVSEIMWVTGTLIGLGKNFLRVGVMHVILMCWPWQQNSCSSRLSAEVLCECKPF